jgi:uncharacterized membrane protein (DUF373 family)
VTDDGPASSSPIADRAMAIAETAVYALVAVLLVGGSIVVLVATAYELVADVSDGAVDAVAAALDSLLLVFILVELLGAVRATVAERQLVAEPFLLVGIIASIKEIVVASLKAGDTSGDAFTDIITEIAVLGFVVLLLATSSFLVRRKEREPAEAA